MKPTLLIVEDEINTRKPLADHFRTHGWEVSEAKGILEAESILRYNRFDVAIIDRMLSDGSGDGIANLILRETPSTCVMILTAWPDIATAAPWGRKGVYRYLEKGPGTPPQTLLRLAKSGMAWTRFCERKRMLVSFKTESELLDFIIETTKLCFQPEAYCLALFSINTIAKSLIVKRIFSAKAMESPSEGEKLDSGRRFVVELMEGKGEILAKSSEKAVLLEPLQNDTCCFMGIRIKGVSQPWGILSLESSQEGKFDDADFEILSELAMFIRQGLLEIQNATIERQKMEAALHQAKANAQDIAHRLRDPLHVIQGESEMLKKKDLESLSLPAEAKQSIVRRIETIREMASNVLTCISEFMDILRPKKLLLCPVRTQEIIDQAVASKKSLWESRGFPPRSWK